MKIFDVLLYVNSSFESFITDVAGVLLDPRDDGDDDDIFVFVGIDVSFLLFHWSDILFLHAWIIFPPFRFLELQQNKKAKNNSKMNLIDVESFQL